MKKIFFSITILMAFVKQTMAQSSDVAIAKAFYHFTYINDTTKREMPLIRDMVLYMGKTGSIYRNVLDEESKPLLYVSNGGSLKNFDIIEESASQIFLDGKSYRVERIIDSKYIITENKPSIDWKLQNETKKIGGYNAQKATARFGGRDYTAWFTSEIPFSYGPWKLQGLPGLILEAQDSKNEIKFDFSGFQAIEKGNIVKIAVPKSFKFKKVSNDEYEEIYKGFIADPEAFMKASLGIAADPNVKITNGSPDSKRFNNPIEIKNK